MKHGPHLARHRRTPGYFKTARRGQTRYFPVPSRFYPDRCLIAIRFTAPGDCGPIVMIRIRAYSTGFASRPTVRIVPVNLCPASWRVGAQNRSVMHGPAQASARRSCRESAAPSSSLCPMPRKARDALDITVTAVDAHGATKILAVPPSAYTTSRSLNMPSIELKSPFSTPSVPSLVMSVILLLTLPPGHAQAWSGFTGSDAAAPYPAFLDPQRDLDSPPQWRDRPSFQIARDELGQLIEVRGKAWVRVDLRVPSVDVENLNATQRLLWLDDLEQASQSLLLELPVGTYDAMDRPDELSSLTLEVSELALDALQASHLVSAVEALPPSPLVVDSSGQATIKLARDAIPDEYIVLFKQEAFSLAARRTGQLGAELSSLAQSLARRHGAERNANWTRAVIGMGVRMSASAAKALAKDPRVALVEENGRVYASEVQTPAVWGLDRVDQRDLPLDDSFHFRNSGGTVTAYIIDTGIRTTHAEFGGRATWGANFADSDDYDCNNHGTHVAGTVGGATYGIAKNVELVAVKVLNCEGSGTYTGVINGIEWVVEHKQGPSVANMSLGGGYSSAVNQAVANAAAAGVSMVVAAGNANADACNYSPSSAPQAITVGASTSGDDRASFSNYGPCLDIFAPGAAITSATAVSDLSTGTWNGTSMAAPHVAGAAVLYLSENPEATPAEVAVALSSSATSGRLATGGLGSGSPNQLLFVDGEDRFMLSASRAGLGTVQSTPLGVDCGASCAASFDRDSTVSLTAEAGDGFDFLEWSGDCSGIDPFCTVTMDAAKSVVAIFVDPNGSSEVFPSGGIWPSGWTSPSDSSAPWQLVAIPAIEGGHSLQSGTIDHSQVSTLQVAGDFSDGTVSFDWTVSSEANYDWLSFYIDGSRQTRISGCDSWSPSCWQSQSYPVSAGPHILRWAYEKDLSADGGVDAGWLDNVVLPILTIADNLPPIADPGGPYNDTVGQELELNGGGSSDSDGTIASYAWDFGDGATGTGVSPTHAYSAAGTYTVTLSVTDDDAAVSDLMTTTATISAAPSTPVEVFSDSFENGQWNGLWEQDTQNDWRASTQRSTEGDSSAEIDGRARDAQLVSVPIDLQGATSATIRFNWFIERGLDNDEYLAFDVSTDGGATWSERTRLAGDVDPEHQWLQEQVALTNLAPGTTLRLRFRGMMSGGAEDANLDDVQVTTLASPGANTHPQADPGGPYIGAVGQEFELHGGGSSDSDGTIASYAWDFGDGATGIGVSPTHAYSVAGTYTVTLRVTDDDAAVSDLVTTTATISAAPGASVEVFYDGFENGQWNGLWEQDTQNDWRTSSQRSTEGDASAEVDGRARDAELVSVPINLQGPTSATIRFSWFIERGLDNGEYLAFDVSTDGGTTWSERARLAGNVDPEQQWREEQIALTSLAPSTALRLRFRGTMSGAAEDANLDDVRVIATP